jgi:hypothetical protein
MNNLGTVTASMLLIFACSVGTESMAQDSRQSEPTVAAPPQVQIVRPWTQEIVAPVSTSAPVARPVRRLAPVDAATLKAMKAEAAHVPATKAAVAQLAAPEGPQPLTSDVAVSFTGLDRLSAANNGSIFFPPDTIVAKSPIRVLEATNSALRLFTTAGGVIGTSDLNTFFGALATNGLLFDPKAFYDRNETNPRIYVVALQRNIAASTGAIWLAISRSANPASLASTQWCRYQISSVRDAGTPDASWGDYPGLGAGRSDLVVTVNNFRFSNDSFTYAIVRTFNKAVANNNAAACPAIPFQTVQASATIGDGAAFTLQPVQSYTSPSSFTNTSNPAYLVSTRFGTSNQYRVWRLANRWTGIGPKFENVTVTGAFTYSLQPDANQLGSTSLLDTGDNRMLQVAGIGNSLYSVHGTGCNIGGGTAESCVRHVRIAVGENAVTGLPTAAIAQQLTFGGGANVFYYWPGIAANTRGDVIVPFHRSSTASFLSSYWTMKELAATRFESATANTVGTCPQIVSNRTGDYIGAQLDPSDLLSFWVAGERATTLNALCQWQTQVQKVVPGSIVPVPVSPQ